MPKRSKHRAGSCKAAKLRWSIESMETEDRVDDKDFEMDVGASTHNIMLDHSIGNIFELCRNQSNFKSLSTLIYVILRHFQLT